MFVRKGVTDRKKQLIMEYQANAPEEYRSPAVVVITISASLPLAASPLENPEEGENWDWD